MRRAQHFGHDGPIGPGARHIVKHVQHRFGQAVGDTHGRDAQHALDGAHRVDRGVAFGDNRAALFHERPREEDDAAVRVHVVWPVLSVVFDHHDQRVVLEAAVGHFLYQQAERVVVVGHLRVRRVHAEFRRAEITEVVVRETHKGQIRQLALRGVLIELAFPLLEQIEVGIVLVVAAEEQVGVVAQTSLGRHGLLHTVRKRRGGHGVDVVHIDAVVAHGEARPQRAVPQVAQACGAFHVGRSHVGRAGQQVRIVRQRGVQCQSLGQRGQADVDVAVIAFPVIGKTAAAAVGHRHRLFGVVSGASGGGPVPAVAADFTAVEEVVQRHEVARQPVVVRRCGRAKHRQPRVAVALRQVTQHLVVGAVFLDDVDHMLDLAAHAGQLCFIAVAADGFWKVIVLRHLPGQARQFSAGWHGHGQEARLGLLPDVLIGGVAVVL